MTLIIQKNKNLFKMSVNFKPIMGFSLIELLIVLMLVAILSLAATSGWHRFIENERKHIMLSQIEQSLNFAKQAALSHHETVSLCAAASDTQCGDNWSNGILIFLDPNNQGQPTSNHLLSRVPRLLNNGIIEWRGWLATKQIHFAADGFPHGSNGTFYLIQSGKEQAIVAINELGRVRIEPSTS
jgi:type IV fimbrial biogenesis protein FimT